MRYHEIASGLRLPISGEEQAILDRIGQQELAAASLDERDAEVARLMCSRGLLHRLKRDGQQVYRVNSLIDVWRHP